jgi:hypothetical protein
MSPRRKPKEQRTRYDLAHDHLKHHFENGTLPLAPPRDEQPANIVAIREGGGSGKECAVNDPLPLPGQRGLGGVRVRVGTSPELPWGLSCRVGRSVAAPTGGTTLSAASSAGPSPRRTFDIDPTWPFRLVRCEVHLGAGSMRCYALRRRQPDQQPLLADSLRAAASSLL